ncbi:MAG: NYN domain-containing protein [Terrimicrobiaceae bacterium]|nr:NYN domain-containing protein [Terrimicrobiaceae bacterium]
MSRVLLVDGHSMIFACPELRALHRRFPSAARQRLVERVRVLHDSGAWVVGVVFDGRGPRASDDSEPGGLAVFYSKSGQAADTLIERLAAKYAKDCEVVVATEDVAERRTVEALGGRGIGLAGLHQEISAAQAGLASAAQPGQVRRR